MNSFIILYIFYKAIFSGSNDDALILHRAIFFYIHSAGTRRFCTPIKSGYAYLDYKDFKYTFSMKQFVSCLATHN